MKILVISNSSRSIVCSARKAGYEAYALDYFGDIDLLRCAEKTRMLGNMTEKEIYEFAGSCDSVITGPGFENLRFKNSLNNKPGIMEKTNDKLNISEKFLSMGIPHPQTSMLKNPSGLEFPLMVKPRFGSGGIKNTLVKNEEELALFSQENNPGEFIAQEFIEGIPCSASLISTGEDSEIVALNEQLIGVPWLTRLPFAYCGNITPFQTKFGDKMADYAKQIALEFKLLGSNGIDFILNEKGLSVIEINPRFQGSLDTIELSTGINIFNSHVRSFAGELPQPGNPVRFAARAIIYAKKNIVISRDMSDRLTRCMDKEKAADIPQPGRRVRADEPITTMLGTGKTRKTTLEEVWKSSSYIAAMTEV
ncbi:MAG: ATP-grasp domain-containing protein [Candidatus Methanoperedens sp.]|nr:ATP-grasp domain-containing protein [Candidatus Methanoperedens sp.]